MVVLFGFLNYGCSGECISGAEVFAWDMGDAEVEPQQSHTKPLDSGRHLLAQAQVVARASFSIWAYRLSVGVRARDFFIYLYFFLFY